MMGECFSEGESEVKCSLKLTETNSSIKIGTTFRDRSFGWMVNETIIED